MSLVKQMGAKTATGLFLFPAEQIFPVAPCFITIKFFSAKILKIYNMEELFQL